jgi:hypothetical protein
MSKKTNHKAKPRKRARAVDVPIGLSAAFKMIAFDGEMPCGADVLCEDAYPHAVRIIDLLHGRTADSEINNDMAIERELQEATRRIYPPVSKAAEDDPAESAGLASFASFRVGFAVCWLLMTQVNGGVR